MNELVNAKSADAVAAPVAQTGAGTDVSIRVSPNYYAIAGMIGVFFAAFFIYSELEYVAAIVVVFSLVVLPLLAWQDRVVFDGRALSRSGFVPRTWCVLNRKRGSLALGEIEQIETQSLRALKRGGSVFYRYRTTVHGEGVKFVFASGGEEYRRMVGMLFPAVAANVLDNRSLELRDYLGDPKEAMMKAEFLHIPSADVLDDAIDLFSRPERRVNRGPAGAGEVSRMEYLRRVANELRLAGSLLQSLEAFRRALLICPRDAQLLFEAARCLHSYGGAERSVGIQRRAVAMLRLAEMRATDDELLARIGESYFQFGDASRAARVFRRLLEKEDGGNFRALRGMAEISLRDGKIAHVIMNFASANRLAETPALRRWTERESEYFNRLNSDEHYLDMEVSRINLLETLERSKRTALRIAFLGLPAIILGIVVGEGLLANVGWAVSSVALLIFAGLIVSIRLFADRIPYELVGENP